MTINTENNLEKNLNENKVEEKNKNSTVEILNKKSEENSNPQENFPLNPQENLEKINSNIKIKSENNQIDLLNKKNENVEPKKRGRKKTITESSTTTKTKKSKKDTYLTNIEAINNEKKYQNEKFISWLKEKYGQDCNNLLINQVKEKYKLFLEQETLKEPKLDIKNDNSPKKSINNGYDIENILTNEELSQNKENILENIQNLKIKSKFFDCFIWQNSYFEYFKELHIHWQQDKDIIKASIDVWGDLVLDFFLQDKEKYKFALKNLLEHNEYNDYQNSIAYQLLSKNGLLLKNEFLKENFNNHENLVEVAINQNGLAIKYASTNLKKNIKIAKLAIKQNAFAYNFIDDSLKSVSEIVENAIFSNIQIIQPYLYNKTYKYHIKPELFQNNTDYFEKILSIQGNYLKYASENIQNNEKLVLKAVSNNGFAIQYASNNLQLNKKILYTAVAQNANSILCLEEYKQIVQSQELISDLLKINGLVLCHIPNPLKEFTILAIQQNPLAIKYARTEQKNDIQIAQMVLKNNPTFIQYFSTNIQNNPEIIEFIIQNDKNNSAYLLLNQNILNNYKNGMLIELALQNSINIFPYLPTKFKNNKNLIFKACIKDINNLNYANNELLIELATIISQQLLQRNLIKELQNNFFNSIENINFKSFDVSYPLPQAAINHREKLLNLHKFLSNKNN